MALQEELDQLTTLIRRETSPRLLQVIDSFIQDLQRQQVSQRSLSVGDAVADFTLRDGMNRSVALHNLLRQGPVVLKFYRGGWCPYCNKELKSLHHARPELEYAGAQVIAITPENPDYIRRTLRRNTLDLSVLHDTNSEVARAFGVAIHLSEFMRAFYRSLGLNLSLRNADVVVRLPLPALYVIGTDFIIRHAFVEEDYTQRAEISEVLAVLQSVPEERIHSYG